MINESARYALYFLGYVPNIAFTARFLVQWLKSEKEGRSVVPKLFWQLSITGNVLLCIHAWIQLQFHVCLISACNGVIAWRNLNLMKESRKQHPLSTIIAVMSLVIITVIICFLLVAPASQWFRIPQNSWNLSPLEISPFWHFLGALGIVLFSSRFWVQWWHAERKHKSELNPLFWWLSLSGGVLSVAYFTYIGDVANVLGPLFGLIPYLRNLMLIYRKSLQAQS